MGDLLAAKWLCLCLSLGLLLNARAQETISVEVKVGQGAEKRSPEDHPRFQAGVELLRPVTTSLGMFIDWKKPLPLEGMLQYRLAKLPLYAQLYGGYFQGNRLYENGSEIHQQGFYFKPGGAWVVTSWGQQRQLLLELNFIYSKGEIEGKNKLRGAVFGDHEVRARLPVETFGAELAVGADLVQLGSFKLKGLLRSYVNTLPQEAGNYAPGAGYVGFLGFGMGLNLYLIHAWGKKANQN